MLIKIENKIVWKDSYPIFLSEDYLKSESLDYGYIKGYMNNELIFLIPFYIYKKAIFKILRFTYGVYFLSKPLINIEEKVLNKVVIELEKLNIDLIMQPTTNVVFNYYPKNSIYAPFGSYQLDLTLSEEELWKNLHSKHRNVIRNAEKKGIQVNENEYNVEEVYSLIKNTFSRSSMGFMSLEKFKNQIDNLGQNIKVFVARTENGEIQGCAVIPYSNYSGYYLHGGSIAKPLTGAMNFLQWKIILFLQKEGVSQYDFVGARVNPEKGSKIEGIQKFKERFGATLHTGYMWKYPIKPWKYRLFNIIYKLLKKSEGDIIDQEREKLR